MVEERWNHQTIELRSRSFVWVSEGVDKIGDRGRNGSYDLSDNERGDLCVEDACGLSTVLFLLQCYITKTREFQEISKKKRDARLFLKRTKSSRFLQFPLNIGTTDHSSHWRKNAPRSSNECSG